MDSLTTAYLICILIGSVGSMAGGFLGNKVFPIGSSAVVKSDDKAPVPAPVPAPASKPVSLDELKSKISNGFGGADEIADIIVLFLKTPVKDWKTISEDFPTLTKKFRQTLTHPNLNKCPQNLLKVCGLVSQKYSNMKDLAQGNQFTELGDQTSEAFHFLENTEQSPPALLSASV